MWTNIPAHILPSPSKPALHSQSNEPSRGMHVPFVEQSCNPEEHLSSNFAPTSVGASVETSLGEVTTAGFKGLRVMSLSPSLTNGSSVTSISSSSTSKPVTFSISEAIALLYMLFKIEKCQYRRMDGAWHVYGISLYSDCCTSDNRYALDKWR